MAFGLGSSLNMTPFWADPATCTWTQNKVVLHLPEEAGGLRELLRGPEPCGKWPSEEGLRWGKVRSPADFAAKANFWLWLVSGQQPPRCPGAYVSMKGHH